MKHLHTMVCVFLLLAILLASPVLAADYLAHITVTESGDNSYTDLPISCSVGNSWMADSGFMLPDARDTRVRTTGGTVLAHMVADNKTLAVMDLPALSSVVLLYSFGNDASDFNIVTGLGGYTTISDNETIELGLDWSVEISGFFKTTAGFVGENIVIKADAFRLYIKAAGDIAASVYPGPVEVVAEDIPSLYHDIIVTGNTTHLILTVDGNMEDTAAFSSNITDTNDDWILGSDVTPYLTYFKITQ